MKIQHKDLFHGAALTQLVEHNSFKALNKADDKYGHYLVNTDRRLLVKLVASIQQLHNRIKSCDEAGAPTTPPAVRCGSHIGTLTARTRIARTVGEDDLCITPPPETSAAVPTCNYSRSPSSREQRPSALILIRPECRAPPPAERLGLRLRVGCRTNRNKGKEVRPLSLRCQPAG